MIDEDFMEIAYLTQIEKANLNANQTEGNISVLKKTENIDGSNLVYVSGACLKYTIKEYWKSKEIELSEKLEKTEGRQVTTQCKPEKYIDDDLFGYMDTDKGVNRTAPVKTNGLISLYQYRGDQNTGVRFSEEGEEHSLYDIEITTNIMRGNIAIELDRIGEYINPELEEDIEGKKSISEEEKEKRYQNLLKAIFHLWGGANQSNFLTSLSPEVMVATTRNDKSLTIGDKLRVNPEYELEIEQLKEAIQYNKENLEEVKIGLFPGFLENEEKVKEEFEELEGVEVMSMSELKDEML